MVSLLSCCLRLLFAGAFCFCLSLVLFVVLLFVVVCRCLLVFVVVCCCLFCLLLEFHRCRVVEQQNGPFWRLIFKVTTTFEKTHEKHTRTQTFVGLPP